MFEFKMSYMEPGYHKPGDPPFSFPPRDVNSIVDSNIIEIEGRNGTGKTTLLNCIAIALGYLNQDKELERKPLLRQKLEDLDKNPTLEYNFRIVCNCPEPLDLILERSKGQRQKYLLNSVPVGIETIEKKFEIVFIAEDDPKKVVTTTLGKLSKYFSDLEKELRVIQSEIQKHIFNIEEYLNFKKKEDKLINDLNNNNEYIRNIQIKINDLKSKLDKAKERDNIINKINLLTKEEEIASRYKELEKEYNMLSKQTEDDFIKKITKERQSLKLINDRLQDVETNIVQICSSLRQYGFPISSEKLLGGDCSELNEINRKIEPYKGKITTKKEMVSDLINTLRKYPNEEKVPLLDKSVREVLEELYEINRKLDSDRAFNLIRALNEVVKQRSYLHIENEKTIKKIHDMQEKCKSLKDFDKIQEEYHKVRDEFLMLQAAKKEDVKALILKLNEFSKADKVEVIQKQLDDLENEKKLKGYIKIKLEEELRLHRENALRKPKFEDKKDQLKSLFEEISRLRENIIQWIQILKDPSEARTQYTSLEEKFCFGLQDFEKFIRAVGEYLGNQFEPVAYDYKQHEIKFFDIEKDTFVTKDDRQIPINKLSQGQSKIATLTGILRKLDPNRKKIVLIDEIADLDPENLSKIKSQLLEEYKKGSVILAILVRPPRELTSKPVEIRGCS